MADRGAYNLIINLRSNIAELKRDMDKAVGILQSSGRLMNQVTAGIAQGFGQGLAREAIAGISKISGALGDLAKKGDEAGAIAENFRKLGGSASSIDAARKAILGTADSFELMQAANEGLIRGIPNLNKNFALLTEFSNRFADANKRETVPVLNELINALATGAPKALQAFGIKLDEGATKAQNQAKAMEQLPLIMERLAPLSQSVSQGQDRLAASMESARKIASISINDNKELTEVYNKLAEAIDAINWEEVGTSIASMISSIVAALPALEGVVGKISQIAQTIRVITGNGSTEDALNIYGGADAGMIGRAFGFEGLQAKINRLEKELENRKITASQHILGGPLGKGVDSILGTELSGPNAEVTASIEAELRRAKYEYSLLQKKLGQLKAGGESKPTVANLPLDPRSDPGYNLWKREQENAEQNRLKSSIANNTKIAKDRASKESKEQDELDAQKSRAAAELLQKEYQDRKKLAQETADDLQDAFSFVFTQLGNDPQYAQIAAKFASEISAGLFSDLQDNQGGFYGLGQTIAKGLGDALNYLFGESRSGSGGQSTTGGGFGSLADLLGANLTTDQAHAQGIQGPGMADGSFSGGVTASDAASTVSAVLTVGQSIFSAGKKDKESGSYAGTGGAAGSGIGAGLGAMTGSPEGAAMGAQVGQFIGSFIGGLASNKPHPDTASRHNFAGWLEDAFKKMGGFTVLDRDNRNPQKITNFIEGPSDRFNRKGWADDFNKQAGKAASTFSGLGDALKELLGITEDIGPQLGAMLGENLNFNVNNARHLVKRLGLDMGDLIDKLVDVGLKGEKTWGEIETGIQGVTEAFKPGLVEVGAFGLALQNVINSGARGFEAVQGIRDFGVEAAEANIKTFEQLREQLLTTFDPETVNGFFQALEQRGVRTVEQLQSLDDRTAGGVIADMQALGVKFQDVGKSIQDGLNASADATSTATSTVREATSAIRELTGALGKTPAPPIEDEIEQPFAVGGLISRPTRALMGEMGPEAVLPLSWRNGKLGVSMHSGTVGASTGGGYVINIDARGAAAGVENKIRSAMREAEDRAVRRMTKAVTMSYGRTV